MLQLKATDSRIIQIDYKDEDTIKSAAADLVTKNVSLNVLVHCGGGFRSFPATHMLQCLNLIKVSKFVPSSGMLMDSMI